jgi:hypothetical protein
VLVDDGQRQGFLGLEVVVEAAFGYRAALQISATPKAE